MGAPLSHLVALNDAASLSALARDGKIDRETTKGLLPGAPPLAACVLVAIIHNPKTASQPSTTHADRLNG